MKKYTRETAWKIGFYDLIESLKRTNISMAKVVLGEFIEENCTESKIAVIMRNVDKMLEDIRKEYLAIAMTARLKALNAESNASDSDAPETEER